MGEPDQAHENPYRSPMTDSEDGKRRVEPSAAPTGGTPGCLRFSAHMLIASFLAPTAGAAMYSFVSMKMGDNLFSHLIGCIVNGAFFVIVIWFIVIPFGFGTYVLCLAVNESRVTNVAAWVASGGLIGLGFGTFLKFLTDAPETTLLTVGGIIGLVSGLLLWWLWIISPTINWGQPRDTAHTL